MTVGPRPGIVVVTVTVGLALALCLPVFAGPVPARTFVQDGKLIDEIVVPGRPPEGFRALAVVVPATNEAAGIVTLSNVPAFDWSYGCSATSAAMMMGYYDNSGYSNMYAGPTNGGICPMNNSAWGSGECPLSATHLGYDGRNIKGHVDDYWRAYGNCNSDPYVGNWTEHTQGDCTGDFMGTNQSKYSNCDASTTFYWYTDGTPIYDYTGAEPSKRDGCHGMKLFVTSRSYTVTTNFSQYIQGYNGNTNGFTFANYMSEIDAGRPVMIQVENHSMVGYGYDSSTQTIYIHDTWDYADHQMTWGGSYSGLQHYGVTVLRLGSSCTPPSITSHPSGGARCPGQSITFSVTASGTPTLSYQWRKNSSSISGATSSSYTISSVTSGDAGSYACVVGNSCGSATSNTATLTVSTPPSIAAQPTDRAVLEGSTASFSVTANGTSLTYQWQVSTDGGGSFANVTTGSGGTTATYTTAAAVIADNGKKFRCVVSGACSPSVTSSAAALTVTPAVVLLSEGFEASFVNGAPAGWNKQFKTATVDWVRNIGDHKGGSAAVGTYNAMLYYGTTSSHETYLISPAISFGTCTTTALLEFWHKQARWSSDQDTLYVYYKTSAGGSWNLVASYTSGVSTWTKRTLTLPNLSSDYYIGFLGNAKYGYGVCIDNVVVSQACCAAAIVGQPQSATRLVGEPVTFGVSATGNGLNYQWRKGGSIIGGANGSSYTIGAVTTADAGSYGCVVSNACGSVTSNAATLTVTSPLSIPAARTLPDGLPVTFTGKAVTYSVPDFLYIEEDSRVCGIRVEKTAHGLAVGDRADIAGWMATNSYTERFVVGTSAARNGTGTIAPVAVRNSALGGADWNYDAVFGSGQKGLGGTVGLNNVGLLVTAWGRFHKLDSTTFTLDDGAGLSIRCVAAPGTELLPDWQYVTADGVCSIYDSGGGAYLPLILVRALRQAY